MKQAVVKREIPLKKLILFFVLGLSACAAIGVGTTTRGTSVFGGILVFSCVVLFFTWISFIKDIYLSYSLLLAFFLRVSLAFAGAFFMILPDSSADAHAFERLGRGVADALTNGTAMPDTSGAYLYSKIVGFIYFLTGREPFFIQFTNVISGVLVVYLIYKLILELGASSRNACLGSFIAALFPTLNLYSALILRENTVTLFTILSFLCFFRWLNKGSWLNASFSIVFIIAASAFHGAMIFIGLVYTLFFSFFRPKVKKWNLFNKQVLAMILAVIVIAGLFSSRIINKLPSDLTLLLSPAYLSQRLAAISVGNGAYLTQMMPVSLGDLIWQTPVRILYFIYTPFLWMVKGIGDVIGLVDAIIYLILTIFMITGLKRIREKSKANYTAAVLAFIVCLTVFAWGTSNFGTAIRHRQKFAPLIISIASVGMFKKDDEYLTEQ